MILKLLFDDHVLNLNRLFTKYQSKLKLSNDELSTLLHMFNLYSEYQKVESSVLLNRLILDKLESLEVLEGLVQKGFIKEYIAEDSNKMKSEYYDISLALKRIDDMYLSLALQQEKDESESESEAIVKILELELNETLTPIQVDTIKKWFIDDGCSFEEMKTIIVNCVSLGKCTFPYVSASVKKLIDSRVINTNEEVQTISDEHLNQFKKVLGSK